MAVTRRDVQTLPASRHAAPSFSVVLCSYAQERWRMLCAAVASVGRQSRPAHEVVVVIDHNPDLLCRATAAFPQAHVIPSLGPRGLSAARNTGAEVAGGEVVAFLDDDAVADEAWLEELGLVYFDPDVIGAGGVATPRWEQAPPAWLPREFYWTIGCSYRGLPTHVAPIRNPIGANMSFRRQVLEQIDGFRSDVGRVGRIPRGCEETELSIRARAAFPAGVVLHVPTASVDHLVPSERTTWRYFLSRCWGEGRSKALVARHVGANNALASERSYAAKILPSGTLGGLRDACVGDLAGLARAAAIVSGLLITAGGYLRGRVEQL